MFFPPSPRCLTPRQAEAISATCPGGPARVGLFVEPTDAEIEAVLAVLPLDVLQVYAPAARAASLRARFGVPVWHAVGIETEADLPLPEPGIDGFLLDAKPPADSALPGGNAASFDWSLLRGWQAPLPWLLAGGLTPGNVGRALALSGAPGVDVSSGVEQRRGVKDPNLIRAFIAAARGVELASAGGAAP